MRLLTISLKSCQRLFPLWRHNFVTWPDLTIFFSRQVAQRMPHKLWKISAWYSKRLSVQLRKTHGGGGGASTPPTLHWQGNVMPVNFFLEKFVFFVLTVISVSSDTFWETPRLHPKQKMQNRTTLVLTQSQYKLNLQLVCRQSWSSWWHSGPNGLSLDIFSLILGHKVYTFMPMSRPLWWFYRSLSCSLT